MTPKKDVRKPVRKVTVGGVTYDIKFKDELRCVSEDKSKGDELYGEARYEPAILSLFRSKSTGLIGHTFYHELAHLFINHYHINEMVGKKGKHDEESIDLLAMAMHEAFDSMGIHIEDYLRPQEK